VLDLLKELWHYLQARRKKQFVGLIILTILTSFTEMVSLGAIFPFITILTQPEKIYTISFLGEFLVDNGFNEADKLIIPLAVAFGLSALIAGAMRLLLLRVSVLLSNATGADLSINVFERTLYQPYKEHISRSSSEVISGITQKVNAATNVLICVVTVITNSFLFLSIMATLLIIDPLIAILAMLIFGLAYGFTAIYTNNKLNLNSEIIAAKQTNVVQSLQESLGAIRDVLLDGTQIIYKNLYGNSIKKLMIASGSNRFINQSPRYAMESLAMILVSVFIVVIFIRDEGIETALPIIGVLALGAQRLLPIMQQIYGNWSSIIGSKASLIDVIKLLNQPMPEVKPVNHRDAFPFNKEINFKNISFSYSPKSKKILDSLDICLTKGSKVGLIGETGSGKSTFLDILMGLLEPKEGAIHVDNEIVTHNNLHKLHSLIAHVPQHIYLADTSIAKNIAFGVNEEDIDYSLLKKVADEALVTKFLNEQEHDLSHLVGERGIRLSGGQRQRIGIARALYKRSGLIIFDEATSSLDENTEREIMKTIYSLDESLTIVLVAHRISTLKECDEIYEMENGSLRLVGSYEDLVSRN
tara:strand:+ start:2046 stop:3800 length:1755 start_codon:yes stop_codon:yes gene_type:complete